MKALSDLIGKTIQTVIQVDQKIVLVFTDDTCVHITGDDAYGPRIQFPAVLQERLVRMVTLT